jgi:NAD(P)-dependent dehydrogenase (short-subunit alcohol dehydrogenase family)
MPLDNLVPSALNHKVALVTGAGREAGRAVALALAKRGVRLALSDLTPMQLEETARLVRELGGQATTHIADPSKSLAAHMLVEEALDAWECLDILVLYPQAAPNQRLLEMDEWDFQRTLETNVNGPFLLMQTAGNWMRNERRSGTALILISTGETPPTDPRQGAFYASQMALRALTRSAAREFVEYNIRVVGLCMGEMQGSVAAAAEQAAFLCDPSSNVPAGTIVE